MTSQSRPLTPLERRTVAAVAVATGLLGLLGFANSFTRVRVAAGPSFGWWAWTVPLGVDVGIATFSALDIVLARLDMRIRWLRLIPWGLVAATVYLNIAGETSWFGRVAHAVLPGLWVVAVEVAAHTARLRAGIAAGTRMDRIRPSRWVLAFPSTALLWRRMVLWEARSYPDALTRERDRLLARTDLQDTYGARAWRWKAPRRARVLYRLGELAPAGTPARADGAPGRADLEPVVETTSVPAPIRPAVTLNGSSPARPGASHGAFGSSRLEPNAPAGVDGRADLEPTGAVTGDAETTVELSGPDLAAFRALHMPSDLPARPGPTRLEPTFADLEPGCDDDEPDDAPWPSKRSHLYALLAAMPAGVDDTNYALGERLAPIVGLHPSTARRYVADWRDGSSLEPTPPAGSSRDSRTA